MIKTKLFQLFLLVILCTSCSTETDLTENNSYLGKWVLVKMTGSYPNSETEGSQMAWQEFYILKPDGKVTKKRVEMNFTTEIEGTYEIYNDNTSEDLKHLIRIKFPARDNIIATCSNLPEESLYFTSASKMINTYHACDGPGLEYERLK